MSYTIQEERTYPYTKDVLVKAVLGAIGGLEGEVIRNDSEAGRIEAKFKKTILGNVLGDRTQMNLELVSLSPDETKLSMTIYPINPIGQELQFGVRKGVPRKVMTWFIAHVEHRLKN